MHFNLLWFLVGGIVGFVVGLTLVAIDAARDYEKNFGEPEDRG